jgi:hypothetical protein
MKFRFWKPAHGHFFYAELVAGRTMLWGHDSECTAPPVDPDTQHEPQQFTGLTDKNGKEIYEGDIIARAGAMRRYFTRVSRGIQHGHSRPYKKIVEWMGNRRRGVGFNVSTGNIYEIIGNVYENPELLTQPPQE